MAVRQIERLSNAQARRVALAAQGFGDPRPAGVPDRRALRRVLKRTGLLQIDSVNVLARAHYLPLFSRLGCYPNELLEQAAYASTARRPRELFEYWGTRRPCSRWRLNRCCGGGWQTLPSTPGEGCAVSRGRSRTC